MDFLLYFSNTALLRDDHRLKHFYNGPVEFSIWTDYGTAKQPHLKYWGTDSDV